MLTHYGGGGCPPTAPPAAARTRDAVCRHWVKGRCTYGARCRFAHPDLPRDDAVGSARVVVAAAARQIAHSAALLGRLRTDGNRLRALWYAQGARLLPPPDAAARGLTVVLDLDETLVSNREPAERRAVERPFLGELLEQGGRHAELVLWTASTQATLRPVLSQIDPDREHFQHVIFRDPRWFTEPTYTKDLGLLGRPVDRVLLVENTPWCCTRFPHNSILVDDFAVGGRGGGQQQQQKEGAPPADDDALRTVAQLVKECAAEVWQGGSVQRFLRARAREAADVEEVRFHHPNGSEQTFFKVRGQKGARPAAAPPPRAPPVVPAPPAAPRPGTPQPLPSASTFLFADCAPTATVPTAPPTATPPRPRPAAAAPTPTPPPRFGMSIGQAYRATRVSARQLMFPDLHEAPSPPPAHAGARRQAVIGSWRKRRPRPCDTAAPPLPWDFSRSPLVDPAQLVNPLAGLPRE